MDLIDNLVAIVIAVLTSSGMWTWLDRRSTRKSNSTQLLLGLAHDRIVSLGMVYINRGFITKDEYDDFNKYLWSPYKNYGGNGLAEKVVRQLDTLPFGSPQSAIKTDKEKIEVVSIKPEHKHYTGL